MNIYLLEILSKIVRILFVSMVSLFHSFSVSTTTLDASNTVINKSLNANNRIIQHTTQVTYNSKLPSNLSKVITPGVDGVVFVDELNNQKVLREMVPEVVEQGTGDQGEYVGKPLRTLNWGRRLNIYVVKIRRNTHNYVMPKENAALRPGDKVYVVGEQRAIMNFYKVIGQEPCKRMRTLRDFMDSGYPDTDNALSICAVMVTGQEAFAGKVALPVANVIGTVIAFVLLYFVFRIAIRLVGRLLHGVFELPGLRIVNRIGGVLFGLLFSLVFTWIAVKVLTWGFSLFSESDVALLRGFDIEQSFIAKYFYHFNPLDTLLSIK